MTKAIATAASADNTTESADTFRVTIRSIGRAAPASAASIAVGLGVPVQQVMQALYRAPSVLVDGLSTDLARQMATLLGELGCDAVAEPETTPAPTIGTLYDVALHIHDTSRYAQIVAALASFVGGSEDDAARLIGQPPSVILGKVSQATIDALAARLGEGAVLAQSDPAVATYDVFLGACEPHVSARILADLRRRGHATLGDSGCILTDLNKSTADAIWTAHQRTPELRVINRDFLRFDLVLTAGAATPGALGALTDIAGVPAHIAPQLFAAMPITVTEAIANDNLGPAMEALRLAGLTVRADLITFLHLGVAITDAPTPADTAKSLAAMGMPVEAGALRKLPYHLPCHLPELQARVLRDTLHATGARAELIDPAGEPA